MKKKLLLSLLALPFFTFAQHAVTGNFSPAESYKWGIVYQVTPTGTLYTTDTKIDEEGNFAIQFDSEVNPGVYRFVYGVPPEENNFEFIYSGEEDIDLRFDEAAGVSYVVSEENKHWSRYQTEMARLQAEIDSVYNIEPPNKDMLATLFTIQSKFQYSLETDKEPSLAAHFIKASKPYIPTNYLNKNSYEEKQSLQFYQVAHFDDPVLQRSGFLLNTTVQHFNRYPETVPNQLDALQAGLTTTNLEFQKTFLNTVWEVLKNAGQEADANYLSKNHLTPLAKKLKDTALVNKLYKFQSLSIGVKAPNFSWKEADESTRWFHEIVGAENYILVFWSSSCSHCLQELPKLQKAMMTFPKGKYKVIAFGLEDDIYSWRNESLRLPEFVHIPGMGKWENDVGKAYDVSKTPTYFVLDGDKKIQAKPEELEALLAFITME